MQYVVEITTVERRALAVTRFHVGADELPEIGQKMGAAFGTVVEHLGGAGITPSGPAVARYERTGDGFDVAVGFAVDEPFEPDDQVSRLVLEGGEVAHTTHLGPYERLSAAYDALRAGVEAEGFALDDAAPMWEEYWNGPEVPPEETRTDVYWPIAKT